MIIEYIRYTIAEDQQKSFIEAYEQAQRALQSSSHCLGWELTQCVEEKPSFILRIQWDSVEGHLEGFRKSPMFGSFFAAIRPFVGNITEMRHYALTPIVSGKSS